MPHDVMDSARDMGKTTLALNASEFVRNAIKIFCMPYDVMDSARDMGNTTLALEASEFV